MIVETGNKAPDFALPDQTGQTHSLSDFSGDWVVLYFYPKDMTPGCTKEACGFRDSYGDLKKTGVEIIGVSTDSVESHKKFSEKHELPFLLLADAEGKVVEQYGVGSRWAKRVTFLIDPEGEVAKVYKKVSPVSHAEEILKDLETLQEA